VKRLEERTSTLPPETETIVITGAAGRIGRAVVPLLVRPGRELRLVDTAPPPPDGDLPEGATWHEIAIEDDAGMREVLDGASALVHLAGLASERPWADLLRVNIDGTQRVLEAARHTGVRRVLLASSIHAVGFAPAADATSDAPLLPRPDTFYGVTKAAMEALGSLYADRFGMSIVSARICAFTTDTFSGRGGAQWLSPGDMARLIEAAVALDDGRHHLVWGVSDNTDGWFSLEAGYAIGYRPEDDSRAALRLSDGTGPAPLAPYGPLGGVFTDDAHPVGETWG
jgi:uronate dehydrogenase